MVNLGIVSLLGILLVVVLQTNANGIWYVTESHSLRRYTPWQHFRIHYEAVEPSEAPDTLFAVLHSKPEVTLHSHNDKTYYQVKLHKNINFDHKWMKDADGAADGTPPAVGTEPISKAAQAKKVLHKAKPKRFKINFLRKRKILFRKQREGDKFIDSNHELVEDEEIGKVKWSNKIFAFKKGATASAVLPTTNNPLAVGQKGPAPVTN